MFSIVIPLYNKESCIKETIESILNQSFQDFEIVVVNDGSTDRSKRIVESITDSRIYLIFQENKGPSAARNLGVKKAHYDWILFLDADDELLPNALSLFYNLISKHIEYNVFTANFYLSSHGKLKLFSFASRSGEVRNLFKSWITGSFMPCQGTTIFRKSLLGNYPYNERLRRYEDAEMLFKIMRNERWYVSCHPVMIYNTDYAEASKPLRNIDSDFLGHLSFENKSFWEKVLLFQFYRQALRIYGDDARQRYHDIKISQKVIFTGFLCLAFLRINSIKNKICRVILSD